MVPVGNVLHNVALVLFSFFELEHVLCVVVVLLNRIMFCSENIVTEEVPANMEALVAEKRRELIEVISEVDDKLADAFLADEPISSADLEVCLEAKGNSRFLVGPGRWGRNS